KVWFCVNDVPVIPFPTFRYSLAERKTGFLIPTIGYDNQFGFRYRQGFFLDINPSHDVTISPFVLSKRGYGSDLEYHYALSRRAKGEWLGFFIQDTEIDRARGAFRGFHTHQFNPDLSLRVNANLITDRDLLNDLANSGALRALPSLESNFDLNQRLDHGQLYLRAQYLQPVGEGGATTFQRLPEIGHRLVGVRPGQGPAQLGMESTVLYWYREQGFDLGRADLMPTFETDTLSLGHVVGIIPQARLRGVFYTRGTTTTDAVERGTFWIGPRAISRLTRRFSLEGERSLVHTIEPDVIYEYVPATDQSDIVQVDAVDDLPRKNLFTYLVSTRLVEQGRGTSSTWLDLRVGQSYNLGNRQPPAPKLSDLWAKAVVGNVAPTGGSVSLTLDTFFDTGSGEFSQWNTDFRYQQSSIWYVEFSQRFARKGDRVRRGDIWNPLSFGEVLTATEDLKFLTSTGAIRLPLGFTLGAKSYYNFETEQSEELDVVGLYQNPCRCWSLGVYFIEFPDRTQVNFMVSLTGLGSTAGLGARLFQTILGPLFGQERGVPWATR
ncbi:MAG: LPS-assembly protein LptD, partial [Nitrospiraceae bacterium]